MSHVQSEIEERKISSTCKGPLAQNLAESKLWKLGFYVVDGGESHIDRLAIKLEGDYFKFPLEVIGVEVAGYLLDRKSVSITASKLRYDEPNGPFFVVVVETSLGEYSYLVYTYSEMKEFLRNKKPTNSVRARYKGREYTFSLPRKHLQNEYGDYLEKWDKLIK